jgi:hypothetical protein
MFRELYRTANDNDTSLENTIYAKPLVNYKEKPKDKVIIPIESSKRKTDTKVEKENITPRSILKNNEHSNIEIVERPVTPVKRSFISTYIKDNKSDKSMTQSQMNVSNISEDKPMNRSRSYSNTSVITFEKIDYSRLYSKREKAELNLARGFTKDIKKLFDSNMIFYQFLRPSAVIVDIDRHSMEKYTPSLEYLKNSIIGSNNKNNFIEDVSINVSNISRTDRSKFLIIKIEKMRMLKDLSDQNLNPLFQKSMNMK